MNTATLTRLGKRGRALFAGLLVLAALMAAMMTQPERTRAKGERPGLFDYYVLSLSWSPTYCAQVDRRRDRRGRGADSEQCRKGRRLGFVVHGLWPQFRRGWPSQCRVPSERRFVPDAVIRDVLDVMPARGLVIHEWRTHGTCSGLSPRGYFALLERLYRQLTVPKTYVSPSRPLVRSPQQIRRDWAAANREAGFTPDSFTIVCSRSRGGGAVLREVRVCFTPMGRSSRCGENERRAQCRAPSLTIPPVR